VLIQSHDQTCVIATFAHWLKRKTSDEIRGTPKTQGAK
jgi:hypothetical protein